MSDGAVSGSASAPIRTCVGCRTTRVQPDLLRLHLDATGAVRIDRNGAGRGAWLCRDGAPDCLRQAIGRKALARAFRATPEPASVERLIEAVAGLEREARS